MWAPHTMDIILTSHEICQCSTKIFFVSFHLFILVYHSAYLIYQCLCSGQFSVAMVNITKWWLFTSMASVNGLSIEIKTWWWCELVKYYVFMYLCTYIYITVNMLFIYILTWLFHVHHTCFILHILCQFKFFHLLPLFLMRYHFINLWNILVSCAFIRESQTWFVSFNKSNMQEILWFKAVDQL